MLQVGPNQVEEVVAGDGLWTGEGCRGRASLETQQPGHGDEISGMKGVALLDK